MEEKEKYENLDRIALDLESKLKDDFSRRLHEFKNLSIYEGIKEYAAKDLEISNNTWSGWEKKQSFPSTSNYFKICTLIKLKQENPHITLDSPIFEEKYNKELYNFQKFVSDSISLYLDKGHKVKDFLEYNIKDNSVSTWKNGSIPSINNYLKLMTVIFQDSDELDKIVLEPLFINIERTENNDYPIENPIKSEEKDTLIDCFDQNETGNIDYKKEFKKHLSHKIKEYRMKHLLNYSDMGRKTGLTSSMISKIEKESSFPQDYEKHYYLYQMLVNDELDKDESQFLTNKLKDYISTSMKLYMRSNSLELISELSININISKSNLRKWVKKEVLPSFENYFLLMEILYQDHNKKENVILDPLFELDKLEQGFFERKSEEFFNHSAKENLISTTSSLDDKGEMIKKSNTDIDEFLALLAQLGKKILYFSKNKNSRDELRNKLSKNERIMIGDLYLLGRDMLRSEESFQTMIEQIKDNIYTGKRK